MKIIIAGGPKTGKSALSVEFQTTSSVLDEVDHVPHEVKHTDDLINQFDWSALSEEVSRWFDLPGHWVIEGTATVRALRKWLASHPTGKPCDLLIWCETPYVENLTKGQINMAKGCKTIFEEIRQALLDRGVVIEPDESFP